MSETTDKPKLGARAPLGLKRTVETGKVKQSFSHGRSNTVVVEVKKRRILGRPGEAEPAKPEPVAAPEPVARAPEPAPAPKPAPRPADDAASRRERQEQLLRQAEESRLSVLEEARRREDKQAKAASDDERRRAEENRRAEEEAKLRAEEEAKRAEEEVTEQARRAAEPEQPAAPAVAEEEGEDRRPGHARAKHGHVPAKRPEPARPSRGREEHRRERGKLTVTRALDDEGDARARSLAALRRSREKEKRAHQQAGPQAKQVRDVVVPEAITVQELANRMAERGADLVKSLFKMGTPVTVTET